MDIQGYELHALRGGQRVLQENPDINLLLEFWPAGLEQAGVGWEGLVEMLHGLNMDQDLVRTCGLVSFDAQDVRNDISWYVNLFVHRSRYHSTIRRTNCVCPFHKVMLPGFLGKIVLAIIVE